MNTYRTKHFVLQELVPPDIFAERGERAWELLDTRILATADQLRGKFGPIVINNWHDKDGTDWLPGKLYQESGLRSFKSATGKQWSMHRFGRAIDAKFRLVTPREAFDYILAHPDEFPLLTTLENVEQTPTWLHVDTRNHNKGAGIWVVNP